MNKLTDESPFPFGTHQGTKMEDVPVDFYHHFWNEVKAWNDMQVEVMSYIRENLNRLMNEDLRLKWKRHY